MPLTSLSLYHPIFLKVIAFLKKSNYYKQSWQKTKESLPALCCDRHCQCDLSVKVSFFLFGYAFHGH